MKTLTMTVDSSQYKKAVLSQGNRCCNFPRWRPAAILDLIEPEIAPFDLPISKTRP